MLKKRILAAIVVFVFTLTIFAGASVDIDGNSDFTKTSDASSHSFVADSVYKKGESFMVSPFAAGDEELYVCENFEYLGPNENFPANIKVDRPNGIRTDGIRDFGNSIQTLIDNGLKAGVPGGEQSVNSSYWTDSDFALLVNKNTINDNGKITVESYTWDNKPTTSTLDYPIGVEIGLPFLKSSGNTVAAGNNARLGRPFINDIIKSNDDMWFSLLVYLNIDKTSDSSWGNNPEVIGFSIGNDNANWETASPDWDPIFVAAKSGIWTVGEAQRQNGSAYKFLDDKYDPIDDNEKKAKAELKLRQTQLLIGRATLEANGTVTTRLFVVNNESELDELTDSEDVNSLAVATYNSTNMGKPERTITSLSQLNAFGFWLRNSTYIDDIRIGKTLNSVAPKKKHEIESVTFKQSGNILGEEDSLSSKDETKIEVKLANPKNKDLDVKLECMFNVPGHDLPIRKEFVSANLGENLKGFTIPKMSELFPDNIFPTYVDYVISETSGNVDSDGCRNVEGGFNINREIEELKVYYGGKEVSNGSILTVSRSTDIRERSGLFEIATKPLNPSNDSIEWSGEAINGGFVSLKSSDRIISGMASASAAIGKKVGNNPLNLTVGTENISFSFDVTHVPIESIVLKDSTGETFDTTKGIVLIDSSPSKSLAPVYSPVDADILGAVSWSIGGDTSAFKLEQSGERYIISKLNYGVSELDINVNNKSYKFPVNAPSTITEVTKLSFTGGQDGGKFYVQAGDAEIDREIRSFVKIEPSNATVQSLVWEVVEGGDIIEVTNGEINVLKKGVAKIKVSAHNGVSVYADIETIIPISSAGAKNISVMKDETIRLTVGNLSIEPLIQPKADIIEIKYLIDEGEGIISNTKAGIENLGMYSYLTGKMAGTVFLKAVVTCSAVDIETGKLTTATTNVSGINLSVKVEPEKILLDVNGDGSIDKEKNIIYIDRGKAIDVTASFEPNDCNTDSIDWKLIDYIDLGYRGANPYNSYIGSNEKLTGGTVSKPLTFKITSKNGGNIPMLVLKAGKAEKQFTIIEKDPETNSLEYLSKDTSGIISLMEEGRININGDDYISQATTDWRQRTPMIYYFHSKEDNVPVTLELDWQPNRNNDKGYAVIFSSQITHYGKSSTLSKETLSTVEYDVPKQNNTYTKVAFSQASNGEEIYFNKGLNIVEITFDSGMDRHKGVTVKWDENKPGIISKAFNYIDSLSVDNERLNKDIADKGIVNFKPVLTDYLTVVPSDANVDRYNFEIKKVLGKEPNIEIIDPLSGKLHIKKAGESRVEITAVAPDIGFSMSIPVDINVPEVNTATAKVSIDNSGLAGSPLESVNLVPKFLREQAIRVELDKNATNTTTKFVVLNSSGVALTESELENLGIEISGSGNGGKLKIKDSVTFGNYSLEARVLDKDGSVVKTAKIPLNISDNYVKVEKIDIEEKNHHLRRGQSYKLTSEILPSNATNKNVRWELVKSSDSQYVTLRPNGEVVGIKANQNPVLVRMISDDNGMETQTAVNVDPVRISDNLQNEELILTMGITSGQTANPDLNVYNGTAYQDIVNNFRNYTSAYPYETATGKPWNGSSGFRTLSLKKAINDSLTSAFGITALTSEELADMGDNEFAYLVENLINGKHTVDASRFSTRFENLKLSNILPNGSAEPNNTEEFLLRLGAVPKENYEIIGLPLGLNVGLEVLKTNNGGYDLVVVLNGLSVYPIDSDLEFIVKFKPVTTEMEGIETENDIKAVSMIYPALEGETELKLKLNCVQTLIPVITPKDSTIKMAGEYGLSSDHTFSVEVGFENIVIVEREYDTSINDYKNYFLYNYLSTSRPVSIIQGILPEDIYNVKGLPSGMLIEKAEAKGNTVVFTVANNSIAPVTENKDIYVSFAPDIMRRTTDIKSANSASKAIYPSDDVHAATVIKGEAVTGTATTGGGGGGGGGGGAVAKVEKFVNSQSDIIVETTPKGSVVTANVRLDSVMKEISTKQDSLFALDIRESAKGAISSVINFDASIVDAAFENNNIVKLDSGAAVLTMPVGSISPVGKMRYSVQNNDYTIRVSLTDDKGEVKLDETVEIMIIYDTKAFPDTSAIVLARQNPKTNTWEPIEDSMIVANGIMKAEVTSLGSFKVIEKAANEEELPETALEAGFSDLDSVLWAKDAIIALNKMGIIKGQTPTEFGPQDYLTRAQFAALIVRVLGLELSETAPVFEDVLAEDWFKTEVDILSSHGIILGSEGLFRPNDNVTRQEMATIISRALSLSISDSQETDFSDSNDIADWAYEAVSACVKNELLAGMGDNTFAPLENTTRAQAAVVIYRIANN